MASTQTRSFWLVLQLSLQFLLFSPVSGQTISNWVSWSDCSKRCDGYQTRTRQCTPAGADCNVALEDKRKCNEDACFTPGIIVALVFIILMALIVICTIITLYCLMRRRRYRKENYQEKGYADSIGSSHSLRHFPSVSSFPEPNKEPEIGLDSFAFETQEQGIIFGVDDEPKMPNAEQMERHSRDEEIMGKNSFQLVPLTEPAYEELETRPPAPNTLFIKQIITTA